MNAIQRSIAISLFPVIATLSATAQESGKADGGATNTNTTRQEGGTAWRASKLIGADLKTAGGEDVGGIEDVVLDLSSGKVLGLVVSAGGFLGMADTVSVVPASAVRHDAAAKGFTTTYTKEQLSKYPQFKTSDWTTATEATVMDKLRGLRDAIGGDVTAPDNTARNEKDMDEKALSPLDQGTGEADVKTTKDIRSAVVGSDLSFNAKNIKIITKDGKVTLRGVVETKEEHAKVLELAKQHAGEAKVSDELSVK